MIISIASFTVNAQKKATIIGVLIDSAQQSNFINSATISLYKATDTTLVAYTLSDAKGSFKFFNIGTEMQYKIVINAWQYKTIRKEFKISKDSIIFDLGKILLSSKENQLDEVEIIAEIPPIVVRNDTIEFNAPSFKTLPTAFVEDLFKELPGFSLGPNGDILVNGRRVNRILVDGREFFGGDKQIATKQLPANIVSKVIVVDDAVEKRRNPDLSTINTPLIINLTLKKGIKKGAFGKVYAGNALKSRYEMGGILNVFRDTLQISILAYSNNINRSGFSLSDIERIGGFERSGYRNTVMGANGSFSLDNISFGGGDSGLQQSLGAGINFNTIIHKDIKLNTKYYYGRNNTLLDQSASDIQTIGEGRLKSLSTSSIRNIISSHNISGRLEWPINKLTTLYLEPYVLISPAEFLNESEKTSEDGEQRQINATKNTINTIGFNHQYRLSADLDIRTKNPKRTFFLSFLGRKTNGEDNIFNNSKSIFYSGNINSIIDQLRYNDLRSLNLYFSSSYNEPLSKTLTLGTSFNTTYQNNENALLTYYKSPNNQEYNVLIPDYSEIVTQLGIKINARVRLRWAVSKDLSVQPSIIMNAINLNNYFTSYTSVRQRYSFFSPAVTFKYKILTFEYNPTFVEPDIRYIQPVLNNTDPLFIQAGNANLKPTKTFPIFIRVYNYNQKTNFNYNVFANISLKTGFIIMSRKITDEGIQINTPISVDKVWEMSSGGGFGKNFKGKNLQTTLYGSFNISHNQNFIEVNLVRSEAKNFSVNPTLGLRINFNNKMDFAQSYSMSLNSTTYANNYFSRQQFLTQKIKTDLTVRSVKNIVFDSQLSLLLSNQNIAGYKNNISVWNLGMTYLFAKNDRAQLRFSANDLLKSNVNRIIFITENSIRDVQSNSLGRFFMLTLSYNIQNFGAKEKKSTIMGN